MQLRHLSGGRVVRGRAGRRRRGGGAAAAGRHGTRAAHGAAQQPAGGHATSGNTLKPKQMCLSAISVYVMRM